MVLEDKLRSYQPSTTSNIGFDRDGVDVVVVEGVAVGLLLGVERVLDAEQHAFLQFHDVRGGLADGVPLELGAHRSGQVGAAGDVVEVLRLHFLLVRLTVVEVVEVGDYDGHGQGDGEHAGDGAQRAHQLAPHPDGSHVPVADGGHGDHCPPERVRDALEEGALRVRLRVVDGAGEEDDADEEEEDEQAELPHARLESPAQDLEALGVAGELEDAEHAHQTDDPEDGQGHGLVVAPLVDGPLVRPLSAHHGGQRDEVGDDGHEVDAVHGVAAEGHLGGAGQEADEQLEGEPDDAARLDDEEGVRGARHLVLDDARHVVGGVEEAVVLELRQRLQAEDEDRQQDHDDGHDGDHARPLRALGVLEQKPELALQLVLGQGSLLLFDEPPRPRGTC
ncbi:PHB domain-containing protein [Caerostris extrusa]|uniref:PHB domain-containing protein n=1 Tax=Caerostris extrusa TaxID=172846 RepID=A0AAV4U5J9_CAEEX|nr:PHB domain-containing protein [Caerostris extrusa]